MSNITISIVNYCQRELLDRCLATLKDQANLHGWKTVVVDNNSNDQSAEMIAEKHPWVKLIHSAENLGYGRGHNLVYQNCDTPYFFVLNADVQVLPGSIEKLLEVMNNNPKCAIAGPSLLNPDLTIQYCARRFYDWRTIMYRRLPLLKKGKINDWHLMKDWDYQNTRKVDWILGAALLIRRDAFGDNLFDTRYKLYFEDVDLCYFIQKKGWEVLCCPESQMIHDHQRASAQRVFSKLKWIHFCSWLKFYMKSKTFAVDL